MTSHPYDITKELMEAVRDLPSVCELVHFPLQAGSDRVLRKMHRMYTCQEYMEKVLQFREIAPNVKLGTDIIVGFPTESEEEFQQTYNALETIKFSLAFIFAYSPRKGTPAMRWKDDIPEEIKQDRLQRLLRLQENIYNEERQTMIGEEVEILVESFCDKNPTLVKGRTSCWKKVVIPGSEELIGTFQKVKIHGYANQTLLGNINPPEGITFTA